MTSSVNSIFVDSFFCVNDLFGLIATMYLNSTKRPVMNTRNRMKANHELNSCLMTIVDRSVEVRSVAPSEIRFFDSGEMPTNVVIVIIAIVALFI